MYSNCLGQSELNKERCRRMERLGRMMQDMDDMQKAQLCAFTEGLAMALERKGA